MNKKPPKGSAFVNYPLGAVGNSLNQAQAANAQQSSTGEISALMTSITQMMACPMGYVCGHYINFDVPAVRLFGITIRKSYRVSRFVECENGEAIKKRKERILGLGLRVP